jgi:nucleotide-binding universal stress UspA family protein
MFEKMLVCLDGSTLAEQILPYAEAQALSFNSQVILFQVFVTNVPEIVEGGASFREFAGFEAHSREMITKAETYLDNIARNLVSKGMRVDSVVLEAASAGDAIIKYARDNGINFILMATHGHGGIRRLVMGSVAEHVTKESGLPILIIRPQNQ